MTEPQVYLTNKNSEASAGYYDKPIADVLLRDSVGWKVSEPPTDEETAPPEPAQASGQHSDDQS